MSLNIDKLRKRWQINVQEIIIDQQTNVYRGKQGIIQNIKL